MASLKSDYKSVEFLGAIGYGTTKREATEDAKRKIERALAGSYTPEIITAHGIVCLIWRTPDGYTYQLFNPNVPVTGHAFQLAEHDHNAVERSARRHLAQWIFDAYYDSKGLDGAEVIIDVNDMHDHEAWLKWQRCYRAWQAAGEKNAAVRRARADADEWPGQLS